MPNHKQLPLNIPRPLQTIILFPLRQRMAMNIRRKITNRRLHPLIQCTPIRQMTPQAHPRRAHAAITRRQRQQVINRKGRVLIVGGEFLGDLPFVTGVGVFGVVLEGLGASEFVVAGGGCADVALPGDLAGESGDGAGHCVVAFEYLGLWSVGM